MSNAYWDKHGEPKFSRPVDTVKRATTTSWTEQDEHAYREWAGAVYHDATKRELQEMPLPLWQDALIVVGLIFACGAFWVAMVYFLFFS